MELHTAKFLIAKFGKVEIENLHKKEIAQLIIAMDTINLSKGKQLKVHEFKYHQLRNIRKCQLIQILKVTRNVYNMEG